MKSTKFIFIIFLLFQLSSCMEDDITSTGDINLDASSKMLQFFESNDNYINSAQNPALIEAKELYANLGNYYIIDIRKQSDFQLGHIKNSKNISAVNLIEEIEKIASYPKVVLISSTGQHASYCTAILRFLGYKNIYSLNFGMASWHKDFAEPWLNALDNQTDPCFTTNTVMLKETYPLPDINDSSEENIESFAKQRAKNFLAQEFIDDQSTDVLTNISASYDKFNAIAYRVLEGFVNEATGRVIPLKKELYDYSFLVCYGLKNLYKMSHPFSAAFILKEEDGWSFLQSNLNLQNLPVDKIIYVYSINGQESAGVAAYLGMLGYTAKTLLFGVHNFYYVGLSNDSTLNSKIFDSSKIKNFPYETE